MAFAFFLGGERSGKTRICQAWAQSAAPAQLMVSTCYADDQKLANGGSAHKKLCGPSWQILEEPLEPCEAISLFRKTHPDFRGAVVLDSLGIWVNNLMIQNLPPAQIMRRCKELGAYFSNLDLPCAIISEECGLGLMPISAIGRKYMDLLGTANQLMGRIASHVVLAAAGLPLVLKGSPFSNPGLS